LRGGVGEAVLEHAEARFMMATELGALIQEALA